MVNNYALQNSVIFLVLIIICFGACRKEDEPLKQIDPIDTLYFGCDSFYVEDVVSVEGTDVTITTDILGKSVQYGKTLAIFDGDISPRLYPNENQFLLEYVCDLPDSGDVFNFDVRHKVRIALDSAWFLDGSNGLDNILPADPTCPCLIYVLRGHVKRKLYPLPESNYVFENGLCAFGKVLGTGYLLNTNFILQNDRVVTVKATKMWFMYQP
jgi:hypothetical protein